MLTNPRDAFKGQSRSPNIVPFHMLGIVTLSASEAATQCIVIGPVCGSVRVCVCGWVYYHDNSKLRASIFTKLGVRR